MCNLGTLSPTPALAALGRLHVVDPRVATPRSAPAPKAGRGGLASRTLKPSAERGSVWIIRIESCWRSKWVFCCNYCRFHSHVLFLPFLVGLSCCSSFVCTSSTMSSLHLKQHGVRVEYKSISGSHCLRLRYQVWQLKTIQNLWVQKRYKRQSPSSQDFEQGYFDNSLSRFSFEKTSKKHDLGIHEC